MKTIIIFILFLGGIKANAAFKSEKITEGFGVIWSMTELPDGKILFTTRDGAFYTLDLKSKSAKKLKAELQVYHNGQGGLLDIKLHPEFLNNKKVYFSYSCEKGFLRKTTCLATAVLDKNELKSIKEIFAAEPALNSSAHFGSRLTWDNEKNLFMSVGDRYSARDSAQDVKTHLGKIIRLDENGKAEIWSHGHRNPQGLFYDKATATLWEHEHGARGGDEINKIEKGKNYGWPVITHGVDYSGKKIGVGKEKPGMEQPLHAYVPSIAPSGLIVYSGKKHPALKGHLLLGALAGQHINQVAFDGGKVKETKLFENLNERVRDLLETADGDILFSTDSGKIYRLTQE